MKVVKETQNRLHLKFPSNKNISVITNLKGQKYNKLKVLEFAEIKNGHTFWKCLCDCGNTLNAEAYNLKSSHTKSCGCEKTRLIKEKVENSWTKVDEYKVYSGMLSRCNNPNNKSYINYGDRGIKVCKKWSEQRYGFLEFYKSVGRRPTKHHEIERLDNNRGYEPGNCAWVIRDVNAKNKRNTLKIEHNGQTKTARVWAKEYGLQYGTVYWRYRHGLKGDDLFRQINGNDTAKL